MTFVTKYATTNLEEHSTLIKQTIEIITKSNKLTHTRDLKQAQNLIGLSNCQVFQRVIPNYEPLKIQVNFCLRWQTLAFPLVIIVKNFHAGCGEKVLENSGKTRDFSWQSTLMLSGCGLAGADRDVFGTAKLYGRNYSSFRVNYSATLWCPFRNYP